MAKVRAFIVHDELGHIISIARPSTGVQAVISGGEGRAVFETEVEEDELDDGSRSVDIHREEASVISRLAATDKRNY